MFGLFNRFATKKNLFELDNKLSKSFGGVKQDTQVIFEWLQYFNKKIEQQDNTIKQMQQKIDQEHSPEIHSALENIHHLNNKLAETINYCHYLGDKTDDIQSNLKDAEKSKKKSFKEKLLHKITKNSKEYVKNLILNLINKYQSISSVKLREIIVEEQGLCSKSSFYRILKDLEKGDLVDMEHQDNDRIYFTKLTKNAR